MGKYKVGDYVTIKYGSIAWQSKQEWAEMYAQGFCSKDNPGNIISEDDDIWIYDPLPEYVGKEALVTNTIETQDITRYTLFFNGNNTSWFTDKQLK